MQSSFTQLIRPCVFSMATALAVTMPLFSQAQTNQPAPHLKEEMRMPWSRSQERFIRHWQVLGEIPLAAAGEAFATDPFASQGGEATLKPTASSSPKLPDGTTLTWRALTSWGDSIDISDGNGLKRDLVGYAFATVARDRPGKALLCLGSDESVRVWVNGALVLDRRGPRPLTFDEDQVEVDLKAGENALLIKLEQRSGYWAFAARVLEAGALPSRAQEIGPSLTVESPTALVIKTDLNASRSTEPKVTVQAVAAGGTVLAEQVAARGESVRFDPSRWPDGACEIRCTTQKPDGLLFATHLPWYKGDALAAARELVAAGWKADLHTPDGMTIKMLADLVLDRLGKDGLSVTGNPWWAIHAPLMEYAELKLEATGQKFVRERAYGFYRLAWQDEIDGSPQFARAYLPGNYDRSKKWPLVIKLHGYNPPNPVYVRWWAADSRHNLADVEYGKNEGLILIEPHGRGNTQYLGLGDQDVVRAIQLAKEHFNVDEDRVYLTGESMGGWGTWNIGTRHPELFAAIAPIFGGVDYHSSLTDEQIAGLPPLARFLQEKSSSWAQADDLLNLPVFVHHGDVDQSVNVDWSRYGVRLLQRWGYNIRYMEMPGYGHEDLNQFPNLFAWFLTQRRVVQPRHVRVRSAELQNASAYWVTVGQFDRPDRFMVVDAEVCAPNTLRVDTQNVLALTLSPGTQLVDPTKPVKVVWNGAVQTTAVKDGRIALRAQSYQAPGLVKNARIAGPIGDIFNTPFAIVTGTASADPAMNEVGRQKAQALADFWKEWQRQPPRVYKDSELSDSDAARYSLILIGGPDANLVTRKLADQLPLGMAKDQIALGGRSFTAIDARVQLIFPNPLNPQRYVLVAAASSVAGMQFWSPASLRRAEFDFTIEDGHVAGIGQQADRSALWVAGGWFDRAWQVDENLVYDGKPTERSKSALLLGAVSPSSLKPYVGRYEISPGQVVAIEQTGNRLFAKMGEAPPMDLLPAGDDRFYVAEGPTLVVFEKGSSGNVVSFTSSQNGQEFVGKKIE
jgi:predicted esterase